MDKDLNQPVEKQQVGEAAQLSGAVAVHGDLPSASERNVQATLDKLNLDDKLNLSPEQTTTLRSLENSIVKGDLKSLEGTLRSFNGDPEKLQPVMDVLIKDLKAVGVRADYSVNFALNDKEKAEKTGMFGLTTAMTPEDWMTKESKEMCIYTNPNASTWADHMTPVIVPNAMRSPQSNKIDAGTGLKDIAKVIADRASGG